MSINPVTSPLATYIMADCGYSPFDYSHIRSDENPNNRHSWVMLNAEGFVKLQGETIKQKIEGRISCELSVPSELKDRCPAFNRKSDKGTLFLTTKRVVYLPAKPTQDPKFESFSSPILNLQDSTTSSSMWWGWSWKSTCTPVSGGGISPDIPRIDVKFTFSDGGMMDFNENYIRIRERLHHFQEIRRDMPPGADYPDEPLPAYEANQTASSSAPAEPPQQQQQGAALAPAARAEHVRSDSAASRRPDEPPPAYDEAQAQQLNIRLEDHIRDEANRGERDD